MSFKGEFKVAGTTYSIIQGSIPLKQKYNQKGTPSSGVHSGKIKLILEGTNDGTLGNWMSDPTKKQDGKLIFYRTDQDSTFKVIEFEGGYIIDLIEHFTIDFAISESLTSKEDTISIDLSKTDSEDMKTFKQNFQLLLACQRRTGMSYCMLVSIMVEKIKIDGVEHAN